MIIFEMVEHFELLMMGKEKIPMMMNGVTFNYSFVHANYTKIFCKLIRATIVRVNLFRSIFLPLRGVRVRRFNDGGSSGCLRGVVRGVVRVVAVRLVSGRWTHASSAWTHHSKGLLNFLTIHYFVDV